MTELKITDAMLLLQKRYEVNNFRIGILRKQCEMMAAENLECLDQLLKTTDFCRNCVTKGYIVFIGQDQGCAKCQDPIK
jgi:hypothetical protein